MRATDGLIGGVVFLLMLGVGSWTAPRIGGKQVSASADPVVSLAEDPEGSVGSDIGREAVLDLPPEELEGWLIRARTEGPGPDLHPVLRRLAFLRLLWHDPERAMNLAMFEPGWMPWELARRWARVDSEAALEWYRRLEPELRPKLGPGMPTVLAEGQPVGLVDLVTNDHFPTNVGFWRPGLVAAGLEAPQEIETSLEQFHASIRPFAEVGLFAGNLRRDFPATVRSLAEREDGLGLLLQVLEANVTAKDEIPRLMVRSFAEIPAEWHGALVEKARELVEWDPELWLELDEEAAGLEEEHARRLRMAALEVLALRRPEEGIEAALAMRPPPREARHPLWVALREIDRAEPGAAVEWVGRVAAVYGDELPREESEWGLRLSDPLRDPPPELLAPGRREVVDFWAELRKMGEGGEAARDLANQHWRLSIAEMDHFARRLGEMPEAEWLPVADWYFRGALGSNVRSFPPEVAAFLVRPMVLAVEKERIPMELTFVARVVCEVVLEWAWTEPERVSRWVLDLPDGVVRDEAIRNLVLAWWPHDLLAAREFLLGLDEGQRARIEPLVAEQEVLRVR